MGKVTETEIKEKLYQHYGKPPGATDRELHRHRMEDDYGTFGSVHYSLGGSPPKGYAIYIPGHREVSLYDNRGKRFRQMRETVVVDADGDSVA